MEQTSMGKDSSKTAIAKFVPDDDGVLKHTIKVHQQPTSATEKKGPSMIARSNDLIEEIQIKRRFGEGTKPLFERDDVKVNTVADGESISSKKIKSHKASSPSKGVNGLVKQNSPDVTQKFTKKYGSSENPDFRRHSSYEKDNYHKSNSKSGVHLEGHEGNYRPYFSDPIRERDRLRRLYGSPNERRSRSHSPSSNRRRSSHRSRRGSGSPRSRRYTSRHRRRSNSQDRTSWKHNPEHRTSRRSRTRSPRGNRSRRRSSTSSNEDDEREYRHRHHRSQERSYQNVLPTLPPALTNYPCHYHVAPMLALPGVQHRPFLPMVASVRHLPPQALYGGLAGAMPFIPMPMTAYRPHLGHRYPPPRHKINKKN
uniref:Female-specific protein transformer n=2 Tax=Musca domestica TaxID=7370 RepID=TRSF_MUSDO|nr:RecName: Full=Female-specific protein transformer; Short=Md-tra [Musca domestica]